MCSSFCLDNLFQGANYLTSEARSWVEKQIMLAVSCAALDRGIQLSQPDVLVRGISRFPFYAKRKGYSHYGNSLSFILININPTKITHDIFKDIVDVAENKYGFAVAPRFNKFQVFVSCFNNYRDVVGSRL